MTEETLDNQEIEPSELFYNTADVKPDLDETTEEQTPETPEETAEVAEEAEESEETQEIEEIEDYENQVVDLKGEEVTVAQILKWKDEGLMQADYTRKRQADAEAKKEWEADKQSQIDKIVSEKHAGLDDSIAMLEALIDEADSSVNWDELREFDQGEYLKQKELKDKRLQAVEKAKAVKVAKVADDPVYIKEQQEILATSNNWLDEDGTPSKSHKEDLNMLASYLDKNGYTQKDQESIKDAKQWQALLDAARYHKSKEKVEKVKATVKKLPITTKPKKTTKESVKSAVELFYN